MLVPPSAAAKDYLFNPCCTIMAERVQNLSPVVGIRQCLMPSSYLDNRAILEMKSASVDNKQLGKNNSLLDTVLQITMDDVKKQTAAAKEMCLGLELFNFETCLKVGPWGAKHLEILFGCDRQNLVFCKVSFLCECISKKHAGEDASPGGCGRIW